MNVRVYISNGDFNDVPSTPGVYNWYYPLRIFENETFEEFYSRITFFLEYSLLDQGSGLRFHNKNNWREWELSLKTSIIFSSTLKNNWETVKSNRHLRKIIEESSFMFQPLYVGCAKEGLSKRINTHLQGRSDFAKHFSNACKRYMEKKSLKSLPLGSCEIEHLYLSYFSLPNKQHVGVFEKLIQSFSNPIFSQK